MESIKRVGIWIRVSTDFQVKDESPEHHERRARAYAEAKGWEVAEVYRLDAVSGKSVMDLPQAKQMLAHVRSGHITGLIFSKLARLARNTKELLEVADIFRADNADLISLQESIDTSTPAGRLFYTMIAAMAQWEREEISERVAASVPIRAKMGKCTGGAATFGYKWEGNQLVVDEKEAPIRKLLYETFLKCRRKRTTAAILNKMGHRTRKGSKFTDTTVDRLIRDPSAKGIRIANYTHSLGKGKQWVPKPKEEWVTVSCPAIVSDSIWQECVDMLDESLAKHPRGRQVKHLLTGYVYCTCGKKMYVHHEGQNCTYVCQPCNNRMSETDLDSIFHDQLKSYLFTDADISAFLEESNTLIADRTTLLESIQREAATLGKDIDRYVQLRVDNELTKEQFATYCGPLQERQTQLQNQIPDIQAEIDILTIQQLSSDKVIQDATDLYHQWANLDFEERRGIVEIIAEKITVGRTDINISLAYTPSLQNPGKEQHNHVFVDSIIIRLRTARVRPARFRNI